MADYYPLITRAVSGLDKNTGETRRALYERARTALVDQLRGVTPALSETDITRERLALEEAIRRVESDMARKPRDPPPPTPVPPPPIMEPPPPHEARAPARAAPADEPEQDGTDTEEQPKHEDIGEPERIEEKPAGSPLAAPEAPAWSSRPSSAPDLTSWSSRPAPSAPPPRSRPDPFRRDAQRAFDRSPSREPRRPELGRPPGPEPRKPPPRDRAAADLQATDLDDGVKGFDDVVADADDLGAATARTGRNARERYGSLPSPSPEFDRLEPRLPRQDRGPPRRRPAADRARVDVEPEFEPDGEEDQDRAAPRRAGRPLGAAPEGRRIAATREFADEDDGEKRPSFIRRLMPIAIIILLVVGLGTVAYFQQRNILAGVRGAIALVRGPSAVPVPRDTTPQRTKIPDRIGQESPDASTRPGQPQQQEEAPIAQRVVLYEEDPAEAAGKRSLGTAIWRTEMVSPGPGQPVDRQIRADITIPDRNMQITWTLRRNTDKDLPASHTVSITFTLPADFDHGGIAEIRGVLMKPAEQARGTSLTGLAVKVTTGYFLIGLSSVDQEQARNLQLLKERGWLDIAIIYNDGKRAILAMEKGAPGDRAFQQAFAAWGQ